MKTRRRFLGAVAAGSLFVAGCQGGASEGGDAPAETAAGGSAAETTTDDGATLASHPGTQGLGSQPFLGPDPTDATAVIVAFEDPSCPTCRRFEQNAFQRLRSELIETGTVSFVFRGYPVVYPWGEPATRALEATFAADPTAFWALKNHYYETQSAFDADNVLDRTESFLAETAVDAGAVIEAVESQSVRDAVDLDLRAGEAAGIRGTPGFLLFRDGRYRTTVTGAQSYSVFAGALGV
jgi:protein-disulfide isomerase